MSRDPFGERHRRGVQEGIRRQWLRYEKRSRYDELEERVRRLERLERRRLERGTP
jgi:hypothetical protein